MVYCMSLSSMVDFKLLNSGISSRARKCIFLPKNLPAIRAVIANGGMRDIANFCMAIPVNSFFGLRAQSSMKKAGLWILVASRNLKFFLMIHLIIPA